MSKNYFELKEFYRPEFHIYEPIRIKIENIIEVLNPIREALGSPIIISQKSGYRPREYEIVRGRSGNSQHCFMGKGAVDLTCKMDKFQELHELLKNSPFTRTCLYPSERFIHCDFKEVDAPQEFICFDKGWELVE